VKNYPFTIFVFVCALVAESNNVAGWWAIALVGFLSLFAKE